jgi:hypothetical protein
VGEVDSYDILTKVYVLSYSKRLTPCLCIRDITKEDQEQSLTSLATASYLAYKREVDYKGLNEVVTLVIYHQSRMQGVSIGKQCISTTLTHGWPLNPIN